MTTTEIRLFNAEGKALTDIASADDSISLPNAIIVFQDGATACHADSGDVEYDSLGALAQAYRIDLDKLLEQLEDATIRHDGMALILTQDAYADLDPRDTSAVCYLAAAVDTDGNHYRVVWYPYEDFEGDDEGDACDWDSPDRVEAL